MENLRSGMDASTLRLAEEYGNSKSSLATMIYYYKSNRIKEQIIVSCLA
jgi:hypothetical protein